MAKSKRPFRKPGDLKKKPSVNVDMPGHADLNEVSDLTSSASAQVDVPGHRDYVDVPGHRDYLDTEVTPDLPTLNPTKSKLDGSIDKDDLPDK